MAMTSCATYQPLALETHSTLHASLQALEQQLAPKVASILPMPWQTYHLNVNDGLNEVEVALLALMNNASLQANRAQLLEAQAQLIQAGLLVDPQLGVALDIARTTGLVTGGNMSLGFDLQSLVMRDVRQTVATQQAKAVYFNVLWQQWQVIQQARILWRRSWIEQEQMKVLQQQQQQAKYIWQQKSEALEQHNTTLDQHALALAAVIDSKTAYVEAQRQHSRTQHALALMLGLNPRVSVPLQVSQQSRHQWIHPPLEAIDLQPLLENLSSVRPDLMALQAGYHSQEASVRASILAQFPSFSIGMNRSRDTAGVWSFGPWLTLNLPMFDGNRGQVMVSRASRQRLRDEYRAQLLNTQVQIQQMMRDQHLVYLEWKTLKTSLPTLETTVQRMSHALAAGQVDMLVFMRLRKAFFGRQARVLLLEQTLLEQSVALETLLGTWLQGHGMEKKK